MYRLEVPDDMSVTEAIRQVRRADPRGNYDLDYEYRVEAGGACEGLRCYGRQLIGWGPQGCEAPVRVGMLDTAIDLDHKALRDRRIETRRIASGRVHDADRAHGTAVAALFVGNSQAGHAGLLPQGQLYAADVFEHGPSGPRTNAALIAGGFDWLMAQDVDAINVSISGPDSSVLRETLRRVHAAGIPVAAAAGNRGPDAPPQYPAAYPEAVAVTAVDRRMQLYAEAGRGPHIGLAAPGVALWTADASGGGRWSDGTSFAAPFVTASLARLHAQRPDSGVADYDLVLRASARDLGPPGPDPQFGAGLLQAPPCP